MFGKVRLEIDGIHLRIIDGNNQRVKDLLSFSDDKGNVYKMFWQDKDHIVTYVGYLDYLLYHLGDADVIDNTDYNANLCVDDNIFSGIRLYDYQVRCINKALEQRYGVIVSPTGSGKTLMMLAICKTLGMKSLIVVPTRYIKDQIITRATEFGIDVGSYGSGSMVEVGVFRSVSESGDLSLYDVVMFDEYHHMQASSWRSIMSRIRNAKYILGFTGTLYRDLDFDYRVRDVRYVEDYIMLGFSRVIEFVSYRDLLHAGIIVNPVIKFVDFHSKCSGVMGNWNHVYKSCVENNKSRNVLIADRIRTLYNSGRTVLSIFNTHKHMWNVIESLQDIKEYIRIYVGNMVSYVYNGYDFVKEKASYDDMIDDILSGRTRIIISSTVLNEGIDIPMVDGMVLPYVGRAYTRTIQMIGRGLRKYDGKSNVVVYDIYDRTHPYLESQARKRVKIYKSVGFDVVL